VNLDTYKEQLRSEILAYFEANGVRPSLRKTGLASATYYKVKNKQVTRIFHSKWFHIKEKQDERKTKT